MKNILLAVTGLSPQVITETLYALHQNRRPVHEIQAITTRDGKDRILSNLLGGGEGHFYRYLKEYGMPADGIEFGPGNIHVVRDETGVEIADIETESDNEQLLKQCMHLAFRFTRDPETAVFFSVAGGRKTMSSCLTLAAQMYGRSQDRLYHVLISPQFESSRNFFYPPKTPVPIELRNERGETYHMNTRYARVNLIHMPFFSIRGHLSLEFLNAPQDPGTLMLSLVREQKDRLVVNLVTGKVVFKGLELDMMPARMALYAFFAFRKKSCSPKSKTCRDCTECFIDQPEIFDRQDQITDIYRRMCGTRPV
ncbi:MAG: TIGR02584 family CRISPR-associated protein, partial [Desulfobacterales bacterium]|nr:TIGR02584 family CRISPR-associated protein [Desulfobacterales bacterium]